MVVETANKRLKRLRVSKGYSLQGLGDVVGMSKAHLWEMERSLDTVSRASYLNLYKISQALGTTVARLMAI